jgi:hypothetical protein
VTQMRHAILVIPAIVAAALTAVMVILASQNRALAQPGSEPPGLLGTLVLDAERLVQDFLAGAERIAAAGTMGADGAAPPRDPKSW